MLKLSDPRSAFIEKFKRVLDIRLQGLIKLPEILLGNLTSLVELDISCVLLKEVPESIGNLRNLRLMKLNNSSISKLPSYIGNLGKLEELHARCSALEYIPEDIGRLYHLRILDLSESKINELPSTIDRLPFLQHLCLEDCNEIQDLSNLPSSLTSLPVSSKSLWILPDLSNITGLNDLLLHGDMEASNLPEQHLSSNANWINDCP